MRPLPSCLLLVLLSACGAEPEVRSFLLTRQALLVSEDGSCARATETVDLTQSPEFQAAGERLQKVEPGAAEVWVREARARPDSQATRVSGRFEVSGPGEAAHHTFATFQEAPLEEGQPLPVSPDYVGSSHLARLLLEPPYQALLHAEACPDASPAAFRLEVAVEVRLLLRPD